MRGQGEERLHRAKLDKVKPLIRNLHTLHRLHLGVLRHIRGKRRKPSRILNSNRQKRKRKTDSRISDKIWTNRS